MRRLVWSGAWVGVAVWSLFAWGAHSVFELFTDAARSGSVDRVPGFPDEPGPALWMIDLMAGLGGIAAVVVWAIGALAILFVAWLVTRLFFPRRAAPAAPRPLGSQWPPQPPRGFGSPFDKIERIAREARRRTDRR